MPRSSRGGAARDEPEPWRPLLSAEPPIRCARSRSPAKGPKHGPAPASRVRRRTRRSARTEVPRPRRDRHRRHVPGLRVGLCRVEGQGPVDRRQRPCPIFHRPSPPPARRGDRGEPRPRNSARDGRNRPRRDGDPALSAPLSLRLAAGRAARAPASDAPRRRARRIPTGWPSGWASRACRDRTGRWSGSTRPASARPPRCSRLLRRLERGPPGLTCLVTTGTVTSAQILRDRLPEDCVHQFAPVDVVPWVERFLDHWRPDLAVWTESELWPATLCAHRARGIADAADQRAHLDRSFRRWRWMRALVARACSAASTAILAQDDLAGEQLTRARRRRPARLEVAGTLKEGAAPLTHDEAERVRHRPRPRRPPGLARRLHPPGRGRDRRSPPTRRARRALPMLALILAPRHPARGDALAACCARRGLERARSARRASRSRPTRDVYLADTLGEMGLWYRIALGQLRRRHRWSRSAATTRSSRRCSAAPSCTGPHVRNFADGYAPARRGRRGSAGARRGGLAGRSPRRSHRRSRRAHGRRAPGTALQRRGRGDRPRAGGDRRLPRTDAG